MKHLLALICCLLLITACKEKQDDHKTVQTSNIENQYSLPADSFEKIYSFQKDSLSDNCQSENEIICAIEKTVKCALNPTQDYCDKNTMPDFIFYDDSMFADDNGLGRPIEQSFQVLKIKPIDETTIEVFTKGTCDKNWFGNCDGNIIYVMSNQTGKWNVKEVYAVEIIR